MWGPGAAFAATSRAKQPRVSNRAAKAAASCRGTGPALCSDGAAASLCSVLGVRGTAFSILPNLVCFFRVWSVSQYFVAKTTMKTKQSEVMKTPVNKESESSQDAQGEDLRHSKCSNLPILVQVVQQQSQKSNVQPLSLRVSSTAPAAGAWYVTRARKSPNPFSSPAFCSPIYVQFADFQHSSLTVHKIKLSQG